MSSETSFERFTLVFGVGVSGRAAAGLVDATGGRLRYYDDAPFEDRLAQLPQGSRVGAAHGRIPDDWFPRIDRVVLSPGVPLRHEQLLRLRRAGIPVVGELELAFEHCSVPLVAVTGTNGKSTTVTMAADALSRHGLACRSAGNIGTPLSELVLEKDWQTFVVEVSSFQLEAVRTFHPRVAVFTNFAGDHLDWHPDEASYLSAKLRMAERCGEGDVLVHPVDCEPIARGWAHLVSRRLRFGTGREAELRWLDEEERIVGPSWELSLAELRPGLSFEPRYVLSSILAAAAVHEAHGGGRASFEAMLEHFVPLPHRLERVRFFDGVTWIDDSKATNVDASAYALRQSKGPVILLLGGRHKGHAYEPILEAGRGKLRAVVALGEARDLLRDTFEGEVPLEVVESFDEAVSVARHLARPGDTVLLSPACSSYDMFANYKERGRAFRRLVEAM